MDYDPATFTYLRVTDGNNKFMRTNSQSLILPPEATSAGTKVNHSDGSQSNIFSCENWLLGLDSLNFTQTGLNEPLKAIPLTKENVDKYMDQPNEVATADGQACSIAGGGCGD